MPPDFNTASRRANATRKRKTYCLQFGDSGEIRDDTRTAFRMLLTVDTIVSFVIACSLQVLCQISLAFAARQMWWFHVPSLPIDHDTLIVDWFHALRTAV